MTSKATITAVFPKLLVRDVEQSLRYYREMLGFRVSGSFDEPPVFGIVERDGRGLHLKRGEPRLRRNAGEAWGVYFEVRGLDELHAELVGKGVQVLRGPEHVPHGMKELDVADPDGYILCFAEDVAPVRSP